MTVPVRRAPGAEHPVRVRRRGVNPRRLAGLTADQVAVVVSAASARAYGDTIAGQPAEQAPVAHPGVTAGPAAVSVPQAPYSTSQERYR